MLVREASPPQTFTLAGASTITVRMSNPLCSQLKLSPFDSLKQDVETTLDRQTDNMTALTGIWSSVSCTESHQVTKAKKSQKDKECLNV